MEDLISILKSNTATIDAWFTECLENTRAPFMEFLWFLICVCNTAAITKGWTVANVFGPEN